jgi:hypothetical protein
MDFKTFTNEEVETILKLLNEANDAQRVNIYSKNRINKAIEILKK